MKPQNNRRTYLLAAGILAGLAASYTAWNPDGVVELLSGVVDLLAPAGEAAAD